MNYLLKIIFLHVKILIKSINNYIGFNMSGCISSSSSSATVGKYSESRSGRVRPLSEKAKQYFAEMAGSKIYLDEAEDSKKAKNEAKLDLASIFSSPSALPEKRKTTTVGAPPIPVVSRLLSGVDDDVPMLAAGAASAVEETRSLTPLLRSAGLLKVDDEVMGRASTPVTPPLTPLLVSASKVPSSVLSEDEKKTFFTADHLKIIDERYERRSKFRSLTGPFDDVFTKKR